MANRRLNQFHYSYEINPVHVYAKVNIGAAGAPTIVTAQGVTSITRTGTGAYTILLRDNFARLLSSFGVLLNATASAAPIVQLVEDNSALDIGSANVKILCLDAAGAAADPGSGEVLLLDLTLKNSSV